MKGDNIWSLCQGPSNLARGANTEGLTLPMLEDLPIPTVPLAEQEHFTEFPTSWLWPETIAPCLPPN
jgi:hypothetical protein